MSEKMKIEELRELREAIWKIQGWTPWTEEEYPFRKGWSLQDGEVTKLLECDMDDPTTDAAAAMELLKKCYYKCRMIDTFRTQIKPYRFGVTGKWLPAANYECEAETMELAICLFAKKAFTESEPVRE